MADMGNAAMTPLGFRLLAADYTGWDRTMPKPREVITTHATREEAERAKALLMPGRQWATSIQPILPKAAKTKGRR